VADVDPENVTRWSFRWVVNADRIRLDPAAVRLVR